MRAAGSGHPTRLDTVPFPAQDIVGRGQREVPALDGRGLMIGEPMPLALAYVRRYPWMPDREYGLLQLRLAVAAREAGYTLGTIHVEELPTDPRAFEGLLTTVTQLDVRAVIVPSKAHLGRWDHTASKYEQLRRATSAEIIVLDCGT